MFTTACNDDQAILICLKLEEGVSQLVQIKLISLPVRIQVRIYENCESLKGMLICNAKCVVMSVEII